MDSMRKMKILFIVLFAIILLNAVVGEILEMVYRSGYSVCDLDKIVNLDCNSADGVDKSVQNIFELIEVYKCSVIWRKVFIMAVVMTTLYFCISRNEINFKNYFILLIITFTFNYQLMAYMLFHSYLPICHLMKNNLACIKTKSV